MNLIMTLLVRDEEDILKANIDYHLSRGVDFIIATDNLSEDSTAEILLGYEKLGVLKYIFEPHDNYLQYAWVTRMAQMAKIEYGADWVINNDADEFWWPETDASLKNVFERVPPDIDGLVVQRYNFPAVISNTSPFYRSMIYREVKSYNTVGSPLPPKTCHRAYADVHIRQGNHSFERDSADVHTEATDQISILHFPIRTAKQFKNKIMKGGKAYENSDIDPRVGYTWRKLYEEYQQDGLSSFLNRSILTEEQIEAELKNDKLVVDTRLRDHLNNLPV